MDARYGGTSLKTNHLEVPFASMAAFALLCAAPVFGQVVNGNFNGNLAGWNTAGYAAAVPTQGNVAPVSGVYQGLIASGEGACGSGSGGTRTSPTARVGTGHAAASSRVNANFSCGAVPVADVPVATIESDLSLASGSIHTALPNNFSNVTSGAAIWQTFNITAPATVSFNWNFATSEVVPTQWDAALYSWRVGANPATVTELADTTQTGILNQAVGTSPFFSNLMTGYHVVNIPVTVTGTYTLGFVSMQTGDDDVVSGTYISNITPSVAALGGVPVPTSWILALAGIAFVAFVFGMRGFSENRAA